MVMAAEIFLTHPGVGTAGFEQNLIVTTRRTGTPHPHADAIRVTGPPPQSPRFDSLPRLAYVNALFIIGTTRHAHHAGDARWLGATELDSHPARGRRRNRTGRSRGGFAVRLVLAATLALAPRRVAFYFGGDRRQCCLRDRERFRRCVCIARPGRQYRVDFWRPCIQRYSPIRDRRDASLRSPRSFRSASRRPSCSPPLRCLSGWAVQAYSS